MKQINKEKVLEEIKQTKRIINQANMRLNQLETRFKELSFERVEEGKEYYSVALLDGILYTNTAIESGHNIDKRKFEINNYFHTEERAGEVRNKIEFFLKLERFHDIYCPDYVPDWDDVNQYKYVVYFDYQHDKYEVDILAYYKPSINVCFPTKEIAQKVCDILNNEVQCNDKNKTSD